ncbi:hypothetical protein [Candidatus Enterovibrio altilux]|uniref:hypothetical protein n=1 Tax=Candidatus Enterovibrio altilux TaxID=1927128 RepID=UPI000BBC0802|nr:hypothetical protein [Candidatus Enterovibrio luxaltus]
MQDSIEEQGMVTINVPYKRRQYFELKKFFGETFSLREYNAQSKTNDMIQRLKKLTEISAPKRKEVI